MGTGGKRSYGHEVPVGRVPRRSFGDFPIAGKVTRRPQAAKSPRPEETISHLIYNKEAPSSCTPPYTQDDNF